MGELYKAANPIIEKPVEIKNTRMSSIIKWFKKKVLWFKKNVLRKEEKPPKPETMDFIVEKGCHELNPKVFKYYVRRDCAIR
jgi:hypothetical protein